MLLVSVILLLLLNAFLFVTFLPGATAEVVEPKDVTARWGQRIMAALMAVNALAFLLYYAHHTHSLPTP